MIRRPPRSTLLPYTTLSRSQTAVNKFQAGAATRSDTLTATVDVGNALLALLQAQASLATAQANLGRQVGGEACLRLEQGERSEEHTSELQSQSNLVCRLLPD